MVAVVDVVYGAVGIIHLRARLDLVDARHEAVLSDTSIELKLLVGVPVQPPVRACFHGLPAFLMCLEIILGVGDAVCIFRIIVGASIIGHQTLSVPFIHGVMLATCQVRPFVPTMFQGVMKARMHVVVTIVGHYSPAVVFVDQVVAVRVVLVVFLVTYRVPHVGKL